MSNKNIEAMKKIIEEKKKKSAKQGFNKKADMDMTDIRNGFRKIKKGELSDK